MLPLRDNAPSRSIPWVIFAIILVNTLVLCIQSFPGVDNAALVSVLGLIPTRFINWVSLGGIASDPWRYVPLGGSMLLHDGWMHLATNTIYLWTFGRALECRLGRTGVLSTYLLSGIAAALGQLIAHPNSSSAMVGASGAIAGLLGAYLVCFPRATIVVAFPFFLLPWVVRVHAIWFLLGWFALQVGKGLTDIFANTIDPQVAWWAHAIGFTAGLVGALAGRAWQTTPEPVAVALPALPGRVSLGPTFSLRPSLPGVGPRVSYVP